MLKHWLGNHKPLKTNTMKVNFGTAIEAVKQGKRITREGWNGKGMFVFMQVPSTIPKDVVPKMQSLPDSVKNEFMRRFWDEDSDVIQYTDQLAIVYQNNVISGWSPSCADVLAEDWEILD